MESLTPNERKVLELYTDLDCEIFSSRDCEKLSSMRRGEVIGVLRNNYVHIGIVTVPARTNDACLGSRIVSFTFIPDKSNRSGYNALELYRMAPFAKILETDLYDFLYFTKPTEEATLVRFRNLPVRERTADIAQTYARENDGRNFGAYDLLTNNCETFVVYCLEERVHASNRVTKTPGRQASQVLRKLIPWYGMFS